MTPTGEQSMLAHPECGPAPLKGSRLHSNIQRGRVLDAFAEVVADHGYAAASVNQIVSRAGVSRVTFYEFFDSREDCFVCAFDTAVERIGALLVHAYASEPSWRDGVRAALSGLLELLDADPTVARLLVVDSLAGGPRVLQRRTEVLEELAAVVDRGALEVPADLPPPPRLSAEAVVGGIFVVLHGRLLAGEERPPLIELIGSLMSIVVLPYLGARVAAEESTWSQTVAPSDAAVYDLEHARREGAHSRREQSQRAREKAGVASNGLSGLNIRLTYRTLRCVRFIAENPGASNREIAAGAGITDQGQISKLLTRITHLGLAKKISTGAGKPNHWELTDLGESVLRDIEDRTLRWESPNSPDAASDAS